MALVVVPAKPLARAKVRLASVLTPDERRTLCLAMLADVCTAAVAAGCGPVVVVASDTDADAVARSVGAAVVRDPTPEAGLNASLEAAIPTEADGVLIVAGDLPSCTPDDIRSMCGFDGVRIALDAAGIGTTALWRRPGDAIGLLFGPDSAARHRDAAVAAGRAVELIARPSLAFDVDEPDHLKQAWDAPVGRHTRDALTELGFPDRIATL